MDAQSALGAARTHRARGIRHRTAISCLPWATARDCTLLKPCRKGEFCAGADQRARRGKARPDQDIQWVILVVYPSCDRGGAPTRWPIGARLGRATPVKITPEIGWFGVKGRPRSGANDGDSHVVTRSHFRLNPAVRGCRRLRDRAESYRTHPRPLARTARN